MYSILQIFNDLFYVLLILIFSFKLIDIPISIEHFVLIFVVLLLLLIIFNKTKKIGKVRFNKEAQIFKNVNDFFSSIKEIKIYGSYQALVNNFYNNIKKYYETFIYGSVFSVAPKLILEIFVLMAFFISFLYSDQTVEKFIPSIAVIVVLVLRILPPTYRSISNFGAIFFYHSSIKEIDLSYQKKIKKSINSQKVKKKITNLQLKEVSFSYKKTTYPNNILNNFSYNFKKGNIYGLVGNSGSGKTTLLTILSGLINSNKGKILINNKIVRSKDIYSLYDVGFLSQHPFILNENILTNITLNFSHTKKDVNLITRYLKEVTFK